MDKHIRRMQSAPAQYAGMVVVCKPAVFSFSDEKNLCTYWSDGRHIVSETACRCGKRFHLIQEDNN